MFQRSFFDICFCEDAKSKTSFIPSRAKKRHDDSNQDGAGVERAALSTEMMFQHRVSPWSHPRNHRVKMPGEHLAAGLSCVIVRVWTTRVSCVHRSTLTIGDSTGKLVSDNRFVCFDECVSSHDKSTACLTRDRKLLANCKTARVIVEQLVVPSPADRWWWTVV